MGRNLGPSEADDQTTRMMRYDAGKRSTLIAYLLWVLLGWLGLHRFYAGRWISGLIMLLLTGIAFVLKIVLVGYLIFVIPFLWWLLDLFLIPGMIRDYNERLIRRLS